MITIKLLCYNKEVKEDGKNVKVYLQTPYERDMDMSNITVTLPLEETDELIVGKSYNVVIQELEQEKIPPGSILIKGVNVPSHYKCKEPSRS